MKICYIGDGESVHNHFMVEWFLREGHRVLFLTDTPDFFPYPQIQKVVAPRHGYGPLRHLYAARQVWKWIQDWEPDIVHAHNVTGYGYWGALSGFSPLVMTAWGSDLNILAQKNILLRSITSYTLRKSNLITADAIALCQTARALVGKQTKDIRLFQWGIDFEQFNIQIDASFLQWLRAGKHTLFLSTRRLRSIYNIDTIIQAYAQAYPLIPSSRLVIVGDDIDKPKLEKQVQDLDLGRHVLFTGWLPQERLIEALCAADIFLSVPSSDSTALSLLEAFAARLPAIVSDLPANHEWIEPGINGLLVTPGNVDQLARAMIEMALDPHRIQEWGLINRRIVEERGNRETEMRKLETWYHDLFLKSLQTRETCVRSIE